MNFQEQKNCHDLKFNQLRRMEPKKPLLQRNCLLYVSSNINSWIALSCVGCWITMQHYCSNKFILINQVPPKKKKKIVLGDKHHNKILEESLDIFRIIPFYLKIVLDDQHHNTGEISRHLWNYPILPQNKQADPKHQIFTKTQQ